MFSGFIVSESLVCNLEAYTGDSALSIWLQCGFDGASKLAQIDIYSIVILLSVVVDCCLISIIGGRHCHIEATNKNCRQGDLTISGDDQSGGNFV